ncbi:MAG: hypothetical protein Q8O67_11480 [Deltaproteobacteria bacterium]|nr:hypothetical protein [Deltaproteobacteria bacterium]
MTSVNNKPSTSPFDALSKLMGSVGAEAKRATGEVGSRGIEDFNSIGKAIETGGFLGGALQFMDVTSLGHVVGNVADAATGPGDLDPRFKEGLSAATNAVVGNPMYLKDLFDLFTAPSTPGVKPAPAQSVPGPNVEQLRGGQAPSAPGREGRTGFTDDVGGVPTRTYELHLDEVKGARNTLVELTGSLDQLRNDPRVAERYPEIKYALDQQDWSMSAQSSVIIMCVLRDSPEAVRQIEEVGEANGITSTTPALPPAPAAPAAPVDGAPPADFLGDLFKGAMGLLGPALSFLGPLLQNPMVVTALTGIIGAAIAAIPGAQVLLPIVPMLPVLLPLIGTGMTMAGGAATSAAGGGDPIQGLLGAGPSAGGVGDLLGPLGGLLGGGAPGAPVAAAGIAG